MYYLIIYDLPFKKPAKLQKKMETCNFLPIIIFFLLQNSIKMQKNEKNHVKNL